MMKSVVFTFGRMNPPTAGHALLVSKVVETAKQHSADHFVYLSQTHKAPTDPLEFSFKRRVCESAFRGVNISNDLSIKNPYIALEHLKEHYDNVIMVAGGDQVDNFKARFTHYAKAWGIQFDVISAGQRINESAGVEGISATRLRQYAAEGNKTAFFEGLPTTLNASIKQLVYRNTQIGIKRPIK
jgi:nicotinic acid mononucleotide adenylyltransferase